MFTKDLVKQLRDNNINIGKVYIIIGSFFGSVDNLPFTKQSLQNLCRQISREDADEDVPNGGLGTRGKLAQKGVMSLSHQGCREGAVFVVSLAIGRAHAVNRCEMVPCTCQNPTPCRLEMLELRQVTSATLTWCSSECLT